MFRIACILLSLLVGLGAMCGEPNTTIVVKQLTDRSQLPEKTVQLKLQRYALADGELAGAVKRLLGEVCLQDAGHTAFVLKTSVGDTGATQVEVEGIDELQGLTTGKAAWGMVVDGSRCFVLVGKAGDGLFVKAKGKHTLVQEYEVVDEANTLARTMVLTTWSGSKLETKHYIIDGEDLLHQQQRPESEGGPSE